MRSFLLARWLRSLLPTRARTFRKTPPRSLLLEALEDRITPATTFYWTGGGADSNWNTAANWQGGVAPTGSSLTLDNLVFGPLGVSNLNPLDNLPAATFNSITFSASSYNLTASSGAVLTLGNALAPSGAITVNASATGETLAINIALGGTNSGEQTFSMAGGTTLAITGNITGSTGPGLNLTGGGTLTLSGTDSSMTGPVSITSTTTVVVASATALGSTSVTNDTTTVASGAQLQVNNVTGNIGENLILNGAGIGGTGALLNLAGTNTWTGNIQLNSATTFGATAGSLDIEGVISGVGSENVTMVGPAEVIFANNNTYDGSTTINNGILDIQAPNALGTASTSAATQTVTVNSTAAASGTLQLEDPAGIGFTVSKEIVVLNGPGNSNALGALDSINGNNVWANNVILGSAAPNGSAVTIAVALSSSNSEAAGFGSSLTISGVAGATAGTPAITSPNSGGPYNLTKQDAGQLIFTTPNTFTGAVTVAEGVLTIEDSSALGKGSGTTVDSGGTLQLSVANKTEPDSVTGTLTSLQLSEPLTLTGTGGGLGALDSQSGINTWTKPITFSGSEEAIGVDAAPTATGLPYNYDVTGTGKVLDSSLTFTAANLISGSDQLDKVGQGQLILPYANTTFTGPVDIQGGWVTIENDNSLGGYAAGVSQSGQPLITVGQGAALHLLPLSGSMNLTNNFLLSGSGITSAAYPLIDSTSGKDGGALVNLAGINTISGNIQLNGEAGIGVEQIFSSIAGSADYSANAASQLTLTGEQSESAQKVIPISGAPPNGSGLEYDAIENTGAAAGTLILDVAAHGAPDDVQVYAGDETDDPGNAVLLYDSSNNPYGTGGNPSTITSHEGAEITIQYGMPTFIPGTVTDNITVKGKAVQFVQSTAPSEPDPDKVGVVGTSTVVSKGEWNPGTSTLYTAVGGQYADDIEIIINHGGQYLSNGTLKGTAWYYTAQILPAALPNPSGIIKLGSQRLIVQGPGSNSGATVVQQGALRVQNDTALGAGVPTNITTVAPGASLELAAASSGGQPTGLTVSGEALVLQGSGNEVVAGTPNNAQTLALTGAVAGSTQFTLTFAGLTTSTITYAGTIADATDIQAALTKLLTTLGVSGGTVSVTGSAGLYTIVFGGSLTTSQPPILADIVSGTPGSAQVTVSLGDDAPLVNLDADPANLATPASLVGDNTWTGTVSLQTSAAVDVQSGTSLTMSGIVDDSGNHVSSTGSDLTKIGGGDLILSGSNTYHGTTWVNQGTLTVANGQALGGTGYQEDQQLQFFGASTNPASPTQFTLTYTNASVSQTTSTITYTGTAADSVDIQNALNALPMAASGAYFTVTQSGSIFQIYFRGNMAGFPQELVGVKITAGVGTAGVTRVAPGAGGTVVANGAALQLQGNITVSGEPLQVQGNGQAETQTISLSGGSAAAPNPSQFTLSFEGATTPLLTYTGTTADALTIQNALNLLSTVGGTKSGSLVTGPLTVTQSQPGTWTVTFGGSMAGINEPPLTATMASGTPGTVAILANISAQTISFTKPVANTTTFTLSFNGATTSTITYTGVAATDTSAIQIALDALPTIGGIGGAVVVTAAQGGAGQYNVTFQGSLASTGSTQPPLTATITSAAGSGTVAVLPIADATPDNQTIALTGGVAGTTKFTLTFGGVATEPITYTGTAADATSIATALNALQSIGLDMNGSVTVTENAAGNWTVTFAGSFVNGTEPLTGAVVAGAGTIAVSAAASAAPSWVPLGPAPILSNGGVGVIPSAVGSVGAYTMSATLTGLSGPYDMVIDSSGNLYVSNFSGFGGGTVSVFHPGATVPYLALGGLSAPDGMAFDTSGDLFVANEGFNSGGFSGGGSTVSEFSAANLASGGTTASRTLTGLSNPTALAFDSFGDLFVTNGNVVSEFTAGNLASGGTTADNTLTGLNFPVALAFDASGDLFVANAGNNTVSEFTAANLASGGTVPDGPTLTGLNEPNALVFDSSGNLFVANFGANTVSEFFASDLSAGLTTPSQTLTGLNGPAGADFYAGAGGTGLAFDPNGDLLVSNQGANTVSVFAPGATTPGTTLGGLNSPTGLALDASGNLYVADFNYTNGTTVTEFSAPTFSATGNMNTVGPVTSVALDPTNADTIYVTGAGGGAWKTSNGGISWAPLFDSDAPMFAGAIAVAPSDPSIIYLGTGDVSGSEYGTGVYESTNSGQTWTLLTNANGTNPLYGQAISKIVVDPSNPSLIYVASSDQATDEPATAGPPGIYRYNGTAWLDLTSSSSTNGFPQSQQTWSDLALTSSTTLFAALGSKTNTANGVYELTNPASATAATTWVARLFPLPNANVGFIRIVATGTTIYAAITNKTNGDLYAVYSSANSGATWTSITPPTNYLGADGNGISAMGLVNATTIFVGGALNVLEYKGSKWIYVTADASGNQPLLGADAMAVDSSGDLYMGSNAGLSELNAASDWENLDGNLQISLVTSVAVNPSNPDDIVAATAGNGIALYSGIPGWTNLGGQGGGQVAIDPSNTDLVYAMVDGKLQQIDTTSAGTTVKALLSVAGGTNAPFVLDPLNTSRLVVGGTALSESLNGGKTWTSLAANLLAASPVETLTFNGLKPGDTYQLSLSGSPTATLTWTGTAADATTIANAIDLLPGVGGPVTVTEAGAVFTVTFKVVQPLLGTKVLTGTGKIVAGRAPINVTNLAIAGLQGPYQADPGFPGLADLGADNDDPNTIYVTNGTNLYVTKNLGASWVARTPTPTGSGTLQIADIMVDPDDRDTAWIVSRAPVGAGGLGANRVMMTTNAGQTWTDITANLPDIPTWTITLDPVNNYLYVGNDNGVYVSTNGGESWQHFGTGMPNVRVTQIVLNQNLNTLTAATYGRGVFQLSLTSTQANTGALSSVNGAPVWTGNVVLTGNTTINSGGTQIYSTGQSDSGLTISGSISDLSAGADYTLSKIGAGVLTLAGADTYGGLTQIEQGAIQTQNAAALSGSSTVVDNGTALELDSNLNAEPITLNGNGFEFSGHYAGSLWNIDGNNTLAGVITMNTNATIGVAAGSSLTVTGSLVDPGATSAYNLTKELTGTLELASADNYHGTTTVNQGALALGNAKALGAGAVTVLDQSQLQLLGSITVAGATANLSGSGIGGVGGAMIASGGASTWTGPINLASLPAFSPASTPASTVVIGAVKATDSLTLAGTIAQVGGTFGLGIADGGMVILDNTKGNTYAGGTTIASGTLRVQVAGDLGAANASGKVVTTVAAGAALQLDGDPTDAGKSLTFDATHVLDLNGTGPTGAGALENVSGNNTWQGPIYLQSNTAIGADAQPLSSPTTQTQLTISGVIADPTPVPVPVGNLTKLGTGTVILTPAETYSGTTTIGNGTLQVDGSTSSTVILDGGTLAGKGTVGNIGTLAGATGTVAPGDNPPRGTLTSSGGTWNANTTFAVALGNTAGGDALKATGGVTLGGANLSGSVDADVVPGNTFTILTTTGGLVSGTFDQNGVPIANGGTAVVGGHNFAVTYNNNAVTNTGSVVLTALKANVNLSVTSSNLSVAFDAPLTFSASVYPAGGALGQIPTTDTLTFTLTNSSGTSWKQTVNVSATGVTTINSTLFTGQPLAPDTYALAVTYNGDVNNATANAALVPNQVVTSITAGITVSSSAPAAAYNQAFNFAAAVSLLGGTTLTIPTTDTVTFVLNDGHGDVYSQTASVNSSGIATVASTAFTGSSLAVGTYSLSATYNGDATDFINPVTTSLSPLQTVSQANATITLAATNPTTGKPISSVAIGQSALITATVVSTSGALVPPGSVTFLVNGYPQSPTVTLNAAGQATFTFTGTTPGTDLLDATYSGAANYQASSTTSNLSLTVGTDASKVVVTGPSSAGYGAAVTFTATVTAVAPATGTPTGSVTFSVDGTPQTTSVLLNSAGVATLILNNLAGGTTPHVIGASYSGDSTFGPSTASTTASITISAAGTATSVTSSGSPGNVGQPVTFTATVTNTGGTGSITPTGSVQFLVGTASPVTETLSSGGTATYTPSPNLAAGSTNVIVKYLGTTNFAASTSKTLVQAVNLYATATTLTSSPNPSYLGQAVTFTATVTDTSGSLAPTGSVQFTLNGGTPMTETLGSNGTATYTPSPNLAAGTYNVIASFVANSTFAGSPSSTLVETVLQYATATAVSSSLSTSSAGQSVTFTATVTNKSGGPTPTGGTVTFLDGTTAIGTGTLLNGKATFATTTLAGGTHGITASYAGSGTAYGPSTSSALSHVVNAVASTLTLAASQSATSYNGPAQPSLTFTATVGKGTGTLALTGTVTFMVDGTPVTATTWIASTGKATLVLPSTGTGSLGVGTHTISATYTGDPSYKNSTSKALTQTVLSGQPTATLNAVASVASVPTGTAFSIKVTALDSSGFTAALANAVVKIAIESGPAGATLGGTLSGKFVGGVFTFGTETLNLAGTYVLQISSGGITTTVTITATTATRGRGR